MSDSKSSGGGFVLPLFVVLLQVLFIALKLTGQIDWEWGYVLLPSILWFAFWGIVIVVLLVFIGVICCIINMFKS
jgi:hypothetical protein